MAWAYAYGVEIHGPCDQFLLFFPGLVLLYITLATAPRQPSPSPRLISTIFNQFTTIIQIVSSTSDYISVFISILGMEIPEINMISDFEVGMKCLQNPSLISRFFPFPVPQFFNFWKWGALIFTIFATFGSIIRRIKLILIRFRVVKSAFHNKEDQIFEFDDDEVSLSSSDDDDDDVRDSPTTSSDQDFRLKNSRLCFRSQGQRRRRSSFCSGPWSDFTSGKNVVKLWDSLGLNLDFDEDLFNYDPQTVVSTWEFDQLRTDKEFPGGVWNISAASAPTVLLKAEGNRKGDGVVVTGYDTRMRRSIPALYGEWSSPSEKVASLSGGGVGQVYIRDDGNGVLTVGDVRNVRRALEGVREVDGDTGWGADAVIGEKDFDDC